MPIFSAAQVAGFAELRRQQAYGDAHRLTPRERFERAIAIREAFPDPIVPGKIRRTDEPPELWIRIKQHLRTCR